VAQAALKDTAAAEGALCVSQGARARCCSSQVRACAYRHDSWRAAAAATDRGPLDRPAAGPLPGQRHGALSDVSRDCPPYTHTYTDTHATLYNVIKKVPHGHDGGAGRARGGLCVCGGAGARPAQRPRPGCVHARARNALFGPWQDARGRRPPCLPRWAARHPSPAGARVRRGGPVALPGRQPPRRAARGRTRHGRDCNAPSGKKRAGALTLYAWWCVRVCVGGWVGGWVGGRSSASRRACSCGK
jgi:hypothetical protein